MTRAWAMGLAAALALLSAGTFAADDTIAGEWWTPGFNARVRIEPCSAGVCGRIVWLWHEQPSGIADKQPLIGRLVIDGMSSTEPGRWQGGRLYNPEDGRDYKGTLRLVSPTRLKVEGCVAFICQTQLWLRADAQRCPPVSPL
jgi:uncharacterized protein (DUF2147 family)